VFFCFQHTRIGNTLYYATSMKKSLNSSIDDAEWLEFLQSFLTPSDHVDSDLKLVFGPLKSVLGVTAMGQTFPPVAILAVAVPAVGFGDLPALIALSIFGVLPVLQATLAGLGSVPQPVLESARAMGMTQRQILKEVQIPLALPLWLAGVRTSVVVNIGTAAIASTVGAKTLGLPIIIGLSGFNTAYVLQGATMVALLAITADLAFDSLAHILHGKATVSVDDQA